MTDFEADKIMTVGDLVRCPSTLDQDLPGHKRGNAGEYPAFRNKFGEPFKAFVLP